MKIQNLSFQNTLFLFLSKLKIKMKEEFTTQKYKSQTTFLNLNFDNISTYSSLIVLTIE